MPGTTSGVAGQGTPHSDRHGAERSIGRAARSAGALLVFSAALAPAWGAEPAAQYAAATPASKQSGPKQSGPKQNGPKQNGPKQNGPKQNGPKQNGAERDGSQELGAKPPTAPADLFAAVDQGTVEAKVVVRDQYHARVMLRNKTAEPVALRLPAQFAARPVLAQQGLFPPTNQNQTSQPQAVSGPFGSGNSPFGTGSGQGQNQNFFGGGGPIFNIPPESVRSVSIACFCVEMGKPNPRSIHSYELVPFEGVGGDPTLAAVFERFAQGDLDREAVQAAVWHLANEKSWDDLRRLSRRIALNAEAPIFSGRQLALARNLVDYAAGQVARFPDRYASKPQESASKSDVPAEPAVVGAGRRVPSSAEQYRAPPGINARKQ